MNQFCIPKTPFRPVDSAAPFDISVSALPGGAEMIPGSPITRMRDAAVRGDLAALHFQAVAMRGPLQVLKTADDNSDVDKVIDALEKLGISAGRLVADITRYISLAKSAIDLTNALLGFSNAFLGDDNTTTVTAFPGEAGVAPTLVAIDLSARVRKENKGLVILDNTEAIQEATVGASVQRGPAVQSLILTVTLSAFGFGQDQMTAPLRVVNGSGNGPAAPEPVTQDIDRAGTAIVQRSVFQRFNTSGLSIALTPAPGQIDYGLNGANVALLLEVEGTALTQFGAVGLRPARALALGLSI